MRFTRPIEERRPLGAPRFEAWSPKLARRLSLYHRWAFEQWILLEADPEVVAFCERPYQTDWLGKPRLVDFWVRREDGDYGLIVDAEGGAGEADPPNLTLRRVTVIDLMAKETWIGNWKLILPYLTANAGLVPADWRAEIEEALREPLTVGELEQRFQGRDLVLLRTAVFQLLQVGRLDSAPWHEASWGPGTLLRRTS